MCIVNTLALRRILTNLMDNALKLWRRQLVELRCDRFDNEVVLRVLDRGEVAKNVLITTLKVIA